MNEPVLFMPRVLTRERRPNAAPIIRESWLIRDLTMIEQDWSRLDSPACDRLPARSVCAMEFSNERNGR